MMNNQEWTDMLGKDVAAITTELEWRLFLAERCKATADRDNEETTRKWQAAQEEWCKKGDRKAKKPVAPKIDHKTIKLWINTIRDCHIALAALWGDERTS